MTSASSQPSAKSTATAKLITKKLAVKQPSSSSEQADWSGDDKSSESVRDYSSEPEKNGAAKVNVRVGEPEKDGAAKVHFRVDIGRGRGEFTVHLVPRKPRRAKLNAQAFDWDFKLYVFSDFQNYYRCNAEARWRAARSAQTSADNLVRHCGETPVMKEILNTILKPFVHETPSDENSHKVLFEFFYVPLRWRCEFLHQQRIPEEEWHSHELSNENKIASWDYVKRDVWKNYLSPWQRENKARSTINLIINRTSKCIHACRLIIAHGVSNEETLMFALHALRYNCGICPPGMNLARFATEVAQAQVKIQLQPGPGQRLKKPRLTQDREGR